MRLHTGLGVAVLAFLVAFPLAAQENRRVRLDYALGAGATACPQRGELSDAVAAELGYLPFNDSATETLEVRIVEQGGSLVAQLTLRDQEGKVVGERELSSAAGDCGELSRALALAVAIAIDPLRAGAPKQDPAPKQVTPEPEPPPPVVQPPKPAPQPPPPSEPLAVRVAAGGLVALGVAPALAPGLWVHGGVGFGDFSIGLDGRATLSASSSDSRGTVSASLIAATLVPCLHLDAVFFCPTATLGALQGSGENVDRPKKATTLHAAAGARVGLEVPRDRNLSLIAHGGIDANLTRTTLRIDGQEAWASPTLSGGFAAGARLRF